MASKYPRYVESHRSGDLRVKIAEAHRRLTRCTLCPRRCEVNRLEEETGYCQTGSSAWVASYDAHFGEESPLVGRNGSGTIFFSHCNLLCNFCQNYDISHHGVGREVSDDHLADMMLSLQADGCHNINFVTPSHVVPQILAALATAADKGLNVPLVYNSSGYDLAETLTLLEGVIDIYMPDFKFWDADIALQTCHAPDYGEIAQAALMEMHRQVGDLVMDDNGVAVRGLLVRHLVMPRNLANTREIMRFIATRISRHTYVNVMAQYRPCGDASQTKGLDRAITAKEYQQAVKDAMAAGIHRLDRRRRTFIAF